MCTLPHNSGLPCDEPRATSKHGKGTPLSAHSNSLACTRTTATHSLHALATTPRRLATTTSCRWKGEQGRDVFLVVPGGLKASCELGKRLLVALEVMERSVREQCPKHIKATLALISTGRTGMYEQRLRSEAHSGCFTSLSPSLLCGILQRPPCSLTAGRHVRPSVLSV